MLVQSCRLQPRVRARQHSPVADTAVDNRKAAAVVRIAAAVARKVAVVGRMVAAAAAVARKAAVDRAAARLPAGMAVTSLEKSFLSLGSIGSTVPNGL